MPEPNGRAEKRATAFRSECAVAIRIAATRQRVWSLLTRAADFPRWNSTVTSIDGDIALGGKLTVRVPLAPKRAFHPEVIDFVPEERMVWAEGMAPMFRGRRTFTVAASGDGAVEFTMIEVLSGIMLPMIKGSLPDFAPAFETYAADLKREAERSA
ncbi:MAG TPA: SRPBCC domain-containing protein [Polyangia bacterium]|jgi:uncharacterized protein YndB with AHSA1/START domain